MEEIFQEMGLSKREASCYIALLEIGPSKVGNILKRTEIPSSKIYGILNQLCKRGLVSYIIKNNIRYYQASNPRILIDYAEKVNKNNYNQKLK